jgi:plasmid stabilization system protein ParE
MDFKVIYQPLALDDLEAIVRHVAEKDLQAVETAQSVDEKTIPLDK